MADDTAAADVDQQPEAGEDERHLQHTDENKKAASVSSPTLSDSQEDQDQEKAEDRTSNQKQLQQRHKPQSEAQVSV